MRTRITLGDYYRMPLPDGRWAYCHHIAKNDQLGYLVRVLHRVTSDPLDSADTLVGSDEMFPPVFVGLLASVRSGRWRKIGVIPIEPFIFPRFRSTIGTKPGIYHDWQIWDGKVNTPIGRLPQHLRSLELEQVWGDEGLEERIVAGKYRGDLML